MRKPRIVIIGGGFAGVKCAQTLLAKARREVEVTLFSRDNHMVFQPLLADVAGSSLNPRAVAIPLRQLLPGVMCRAEEVTAIDPAKNEIAYESHDGALRTLAYDHLVIACGNVVNLNLLPGMANHALPLKTVGDAIAMRAHVMQQLEKADLAETEAQRRYYLTFVVVGGGFSGVEVAGELNDLILSCRKRYPNIRREDVMVTLLHGQAQLLPEVSEPLRLFAEERMRRRGIIVRTNAKVTEVTRHGAILGDGTKVEGNTIICTIGTTTNPLIARFEAKKERGRLLTEPDMRVIGRDNIWAIGDCAIVPNAHDGKPAPPTAQFGERQGGQCALNIVRRIGNQPTRAFSFKPLGIACGIGGHQGVAELFGLRFSGFIAWWLWRSAFLVKIPSLVQKLKVGFDWAWELVFPRDLSHFRPSVSDPVNQQHYAAGETLLRHDQVLKEIYCIESGEAEVVRVGADGAIESLLTLPEGSLVGEATLADFAGTAVSVRAKSALDVVVLGKTSLSKLSSALKPVEEIIERAVNRPKLSIWRNHPTAMQALSATSVGDLPSSYPTLCVDVEDGLGKAYALLIELKAGCAAVTREGRLAGIVTRSDLLAALARGARRGTPVGTAMNARVKALASGDSAAMAAELMADNGLKFLPVTDADGGVVKILTSDDFVRYALALER